MIYYLRDLKGKHFILNSTPAWLVNYRDLCTVSGTGKMLTLSGLGAKDSERWHRIKLDCTVVTKEQNPEYFL